MGAAGFDPPLRLKAAYFFLLLGIKAACPWENHSDPRYLGCFHPLQRRILLPAECELCG